MNDEHDPEVTEKVQKGTDLLREAAITKIWGYCRDHATSLDSERTCASIREMVVLTTQAFHQRAESAVLAVRPLRKQIGALRLQVKVQADVIVELLAEVEAGKAAVAELREKLKATKGKRKPAAESVC